MNRLIKVGTFNGASVYVSLDCVQSVSRSADDTASIVLHRDQAYTYVNETPDHVASAINNA